MESKKENDTNELIYQTNIPTETSLMVTKGERWGRDNSGIWD